MAAWHDFSKTAVSKIPATELPGRLLRRILDYLVYHLTEPTKHATPRQATNIRSLGSRLEPGDVILLAGNARISYVVKVLTLSQWSHVVMYVGDRRDLLTEDERAEWTARLGEQCLRHLVIDADPVRRVHLRPLEDFAGSMMRHCRAEALDKKDALRVIDFALEQLGREYDVGHILRLLLFFAFPWELLPEALRRVITDFSLSEDTRICSRVLSEAFHRVGYPIRPIEVVYSRPGVHFRALGFAVGLRQRGRSAARLLAGGRIQQAFSRLTSARYAEIQLRGSKHITPSDYDLSPYFSVIKDEDELSLNYRDANKVCALD